MQRDCLVKKCCLLHGVAGKQPHRYTDTLYYPGARFQEYPTRTTRTRRPFTVQGHQGIIASGHQGMNNGVPQTAPTFLSRAANQRYAGEKPFRPPLNEHPCRRRITRRSQISSSLRRASRLARIRSTIPSSVLRTLKRISGFSNA